MFQHRRNFRLMSALGTALSAGAAALSTAAESVEKFLVTGAMQVTHLFTEQVCHFDTLDQLETFLADVVDRNDWFRHDVPVAPVDAPDPAAQIDTTAAQFDALASTKDA